MADIPINAVFSKLKIPKKNTLAYISILERTERRTGTKVFIAVSHSWEPEKYPKKFFQRNWKIKNFHSIAILVLRNFGHRKPQSSCNIYSIADQYSQEAAAWIHMRRARLPVERENTIR